MKKLKKSQENVNNTYSVIYLRSSCNETVSKDATMHLNKSCRNILKKLHKVSALKLIPHYFELSNKIYKTVVKK